MIRGELIALYNGNQLVDREKKPSLDQAIWSRTLITVALINFCIGVL